MQEWMEYGGFLMIKWEKNQTGQFIVPSWPEICGTMCCPLLVKDF